MAQRHNGTNSRFVGGKSEIERRPFHRSTPYNSSSLVAFLLYVLFKLTYTPMYHRSSRKKHEFSPRGNFSTGKTGARSLIPRDEAALMKQITGSGSIETRSIFFVKSCANVCVMYVINPGSRIVGLTNDVLCENDTLVCSIRSIHPSRSIIASLPIENCDIVRNGKRTDINIEGENYHSSSGKLQLSSLIHISWNVKVLIFEQKIYIFHMGIKKRKMMNRWRSVARCTIVQSCQRSLYYWFRTLIQHLSEGGA